MMNMKTQTDIKGILVTFFRDGTKGDYLDALNTAISEIRAEQNALVTPENYIGTQEWYIPVIECPKCKHKSPARNTFYCGKCGIKFKFSTSVKKFINYI